MIFTPTYIFGYFPVPNAEVGFYLAISVLVWTCLQFLAFSVKFPDWKAQEPGWNKAPKKVSVHGMRDMRNSFVSVFFSCIAGTIVLYGFLLDGWWFDKQANDSQIALLIMFTGHLIVDFIVLVYLEICDSYLFGHHFFTLLGCYFSLTLHVHEACICYVLLITELTYPVSHLRLSLRYYNMKNTKAYHACEVFYHTPFIITRTIWIFPGTYYIISGADTHLVIKILTIGLQLQFWVCARKMVSTLIQKFMIFKKLSEQNIQLHWLTLVPEAEVFFKRPAKKILV